MGYQYNLKPLKHVYMIFKIIWWGVYYMFLVPYVYLIFNFEMQIRKQKMEHIYIELPDRSPRGRPKRRFMKVVRRNRNVVGVKEEDAKDRV